MNIIHIGNFGHGWDGSLCDELHISNALQELGHTVVNIQRENWSKRLTEDNNHVWHPHPTFILLAQWDGFPDYFIDTIRDCYSGVPIIFWCYDYQADGQEWHERLIKGADLYLSKRIADSKYPNWQWLSQDFAPTFLDKVDDPVGEPIDVLFTGSYLPWATERNDILKAVDDKFNLVIHSVTPAQWKELGFKNVYGPLMDDELPNLIARAKINLSIDHTIESGYWSDRNAQIMACGGYVLFRYVPLSETVFGAGVDYFYDKEGCIKKIEQAIDAPSYRQFVSRIGYETATYLNRLRVDGRVYDLLTIVGSIL